MILHCTCEHKAQDELHGKGMRVFNWRHKKKVYRCTVCLREVGGDKPVEEKKDK